eukprot:5528615-Prymnesium_polylepis.1
MSSMALSLVGVILFVFNDITFSFAGIMFCALDVSIGVVLRLMQRRMLVITPVDISLAGMLCINNVCAFLPVAAVAWYLGEPQLWASLLQAATAKDYLLVFSSCILGVAVGWSIILVQQRVTATAMQMLSNMNRLAIIVGGVLFVGE